MRKRNAVRAMLAAGAVAVVLTAIPANATAATSCSAIGKKLAQGLTPPTYCSFNYACTATSCRVGPYLHMDGYFLNLQGGAFRGDLYWARAGGTAVPATGTQTCTVTSPPGIYWVECASGPQYQTLLKGQRLVVLCLARPQNAALLRFMWTKVQCSLRS